MCIGIPMRIESIDGLTALCAARGAERSVSLLMLEEGSVAVGDHVIVNLGYAIRTVSEEEARLSWELFDQILAEQESAR